MCGKPILSSACASAQPDQSLLFPIYRIYDRYRYWEEPVPVSMLIWVTPCAHFLLSRLKFRYTSLNIHLQNINASLFMSFLVLAVSWSWFRILYWSSNIFSQTDPINNTYPYESYIVQLIISDDWYESNHGKCRCSKWNEVHECTGFLYYK